MYVLNSNVERVVLIVTPVNGYEWRFTYQNKMLILFSFSFKYKVSSIIFVINTYNNACDVRIEFPTVVKPP